MTAPGNRTTRIAYDEGDGRPVSSTRQWDDVVHRNRYRYTFSGAVEQQIQEAVATDGVMVQAKRIITFQHNARNQATAVVWPDASITAISRDPLEQVLPVRLPTGPILSISPSVQSPEASNEDTTVRTKTSSLQAFYGEPGSAAANEVLKFEANGKIAIRLLDDFGQVVATQNPGQGWQTAARDAAGRIVETTDASHNRQRANYNLSGQLIELRRYAPAQQAAEKIIQTTWHGPFKSEEKVLGPEGAARHITRYG